MEFFIVDVLEFFDNGFSSHHLQDFKGFDEAKNYAIATLKEEGYEAENIFYDTLQSDDCWENGRLIKNYTEFNVISLNDDDRREENTCTFANHYWWGQKVAIENDNNQVLGKIRITIHCYSI